MEEIIKNCETLSEAIKKTFSFDNGHNRKRFKKLIKERNIDITHLRSRPLRYKRINKICPVCKTEFEDLLGHHREKTTCSHSCSNTYFRSGNNHPNWKDSNSLTHDSKYRRICFEYHKKECVICGESKIVAVHHYDGNHENNDIRNLIPICPTHHQYIHSKYRDEVIDTVNEYREDFIQKNYQKE